MFFGGKRGGNWVNIGEIGGESCSGVGRSCVFFIYFKGRVERIRVWVECVVWKKRVLKRVLRILF